MNWSRVQLVLQVAPLSLVTKWSGQAQARPPPGVSRHRVAQPPPDSPHGFATVTVGTSGVRSGQVTFGGRKIRLRHYKRGRYQVRSLLVAKKSGCVIVNMVEVPSGNCWR